MKPSEAIREIASRRAVDMGNGEKVFSVHPEDILEWLDAHAGGERVFNAATYAVLGEPETHAGGATVAESHRPVSTCAPGPHPVSTSSPLWIIETRDMGEGDDPPWFRVTCSDDRVMGYELQALAEQTSKSGSHEMEGYELRVVPYYRGALDESATPASPAPDPDDERVVDELVARKTSGLAVTRLVPAPQPATGDGAGAARMFQLWAEGYGNEQTWGGLANNERAVWTEAFEFARELGAKEAQPHRIAVRVLRERDELKEKLAAAVEALEETRWSPDGAIAEWANTPDGKNHARVMRALGVLREEKT